MGRRKNRNRTPKTHPNNRPGPRTVHFDDDHFVHGTNPSAKNRHQPNTRGGKNKTFPSHGRSGPPWQGGNKPNNRAFSGPWQQHNNRGQGHRNNRNQHHNPDSNSNPHNRNRRNRRRDSLPSEDDGDLSSLLDSLSAPPFSSIPPPHTNPRTRFCLECSSVRRANLRFRNWACTALQQCSERFTAWAEEAGVGFEAADEMDWQPEPVIRVVLMGTSSGFGVGEPSQGQMMQQQQQQEQHQQSVGNGNIGPIPVPGPWPWPPWRAPETRDPVFWPVRVPSFGLPRLPTTEPDCCSTTTAGIGNGCGSGPMPVSGFGMVGAGGAGGAFSPGERTPSPCPDCEPGRAREQVTIPARGPMEQPAVMSTCGPTLRVGVPSGVRRRSSCEGGFLSCCA
ncbi:hypothetical protein F5Y06DRAFT_307116 [Hypoxylon sp. FL0890]|nr:hypothetical protein F5Y06DRAFT_307116 [Hypoxylon sp. FL0890]